MTTQFLTEEILNRLTPSVFSRMAYEGTSSKYEQIPTIETIRGLKELGFMPVFAKQSRSRLEEKKNFVKHLIRFRQENHSQTIGGIIPEIVLVNSHDGGCSYQLRAGVYRLVCLNGLIVGDDIFCHRIRHQGDVVSKVVEAGKDVVEIFPQVIDTVKSWQEIKLTSKQKKVYAEAVLHLKDGMIKKMIFGLLLM